MRSEAEVYPRRNLIADRTVDLFEEAIDLVPHSCIDQGENALVVGDASNQNGGVNRIGMEVLGPLLERYQPRARATTPAAMAAAPSRRSARSDSPSSVPPASAANSIDTSRAGATWLSGAMRTAYKTIT